MAAGTLIDVERPVASPSTYAQGPERKSRDDQRPVTLRIAVEQLKPGDMLVSPLGKCRVRKVGVRPGQRLIRVRDGFRELVCSPSHNLVLKPEQIDLMSVETLDVTGPVFYIEGEEPHVYLANGFLSHNKLLVY